MPKSKKTTAKSARKPDSILVTFLLDRTGSMASCKDATIEAFNAYLGTLKADPKGVFFTFLQFDSVSLDKIHVADPVKDVAEENHA